MPDYKDEQERLRWIREGMTKGGGGVVEEERRTKRVERNREERDLVGREEKEVLKKGEEEDLRLRREESESRELEETLRKFKEEDARNQLQDNVHVKNEEEEEQIYEQLDNYNHETYELNKEKLANIKITDEQSRENEKGPDPPERGKSLKVGVETNKSNPDHDEKLYVALSCLGGSIKSTEDDVDEIYMKKRDFLGQKSDWDQKSYVAFERPELLYSKSSQEQIQPSMCSNASSTGSEQVDEEFLYSVPGKEHFPTKILCRKSQQKTERSPSSNEENEYFLPADFANNGSHYLAMQSRESLSRADESYEDAFEQRLEKQEEVMTCYDKSPVKHLVTDPPPFIGPLLSSPSSSFRPTMLGTALPRTPTRRAPAPPHKRTLSAPLPTLKPATPPRAFAPRLAPPPPPPPPPPPLQVVPTPALKSGQFALKLKSSLTVPAVPDLMEELQLTLGRRRRRAVTSELEGTPRDESESKGAVTPGEDFDIFLV